MTDLSRGISRPPAGNQEDYDDLAAAFDRRWSRSPQGQANSNGSSKYVNAMLTLLSGLMLTGIVGGIAMYGRVEAMAMQVKATNDKVDLIIQGKIR
jgi:hypothetical protein